MNNSLITTLRPGHKPPQVTMQTFVFVESHNKSALGPALINLIDSAMSQYELYYSFAVTKYSF